MKYFFTTILLAFGMLLNAQTWTPIYNNQKIDGVWANKYLKFPTDTTANKTGVVMVANKFWIGNGTKWSTVSSDTGRNNSQLVTGGSLKKTTDSLGNIISTGLALKKNISDTGFNGGYTTRERTKQQIDSLANAASGIYIPLSQKGANNGVPALDPGGKVPISQLPSSLMIYKGTWSAATNTPTLNNTIGIAGWVYQISNYGIGSYFGTLDTFYVGDYIMYNGSEWEVSSNTVNVRSVSVNGSAAQQGVVSITLPNSSVTNGMLANSTTTIGTTAISLGSSSTSLAGLTTVSGSGAFTASNFVLAGQAGNTGMYYGHTSKLVIANYNTGGGIDFETNGGTINMTLGSDATLSVLGNVIAPAFVGAGSSLTSLPTNTALYPTLNQNTTGNAATATLAANSTQWNAQNYDGSLAMVSAPDYIMGYQTSTNKWKPITAAALQSFAGLGSAAYTNTSAYYASGSTVANSTYWNGKPLTWATATPQSYMLGYNDANGDIRPADINQVKTWLGLGSYAYRSSGLAELSGANFTGGITVTGSNSQFNTGISFNDFTNVLSGNSIFWYNSANTVYAQTYFDGTNWSINKPISISPSYGGGSTNDFLTVSRTGGAVAATLGYDSPNTEMYFGTSTAQGLQIRTGNTTRIHIPASGSAIDFYNPIAGTSATMSSFGRFGNAGANAMLEVAASTGEVFRADAASGAYRIVADQTGVLIGGALSGSSTATFGGSAAYPYLNPIITATTSSNDTRSLVVNNQFNGSGAYAKFIVAAYGNSWHFGMGSNTSTYGNDFTFTSDASASNTPVLRLATTGAATFSSSIISPLFYKNYSTGGTGGSPVWEQIVGYGAANTSYGQIQFGNEYSSNLNTSFRISLYNSGAVNYPLIIASTGAITAANLAGTGDRMVVANSSGVLSTQAIPNVSDYVPYAGATASLDMGAQSVQAYVITSTSNVYNSYQTFPITALNTDYVLSGAGRGMLRISDHSYGGTALYLIDFITGTFTTIASSLVGTYTLVFSSGQWYLRKTAGSVPSTIGWTMYQ